MHLLYHILLLIICFDTFIHCRGGHGGGGGGRGGGRGGRVSSGVGGGVGGGGHGGQGDFDGSGIWSSRYFEYNKWYNGVDILLSFDSQLMKVTGSGSYGVGVFTIDGIYSTETNRIALTINSPPSTDDLAQNLRQQFTIQVTWNTQNGQFEGKWFGQTNTYCGEGKYTLKFKETPNYV